VLVQQSTCGMVKTACETKKCGMCKEVKPLDRFETRQRRGKLGVITFHRSYCKECRKIYNRKTRKTDEYRRKNAEYRRKRRREDINFLVAHRLRNRLYMALKGRKKTGKTMHLVGCSKKEMVEWIESQFKDGMSWENIHIDHMIPCASFDDLSSPEQQKRCFHYTNLQPMFSLANMGKGAKILYDMKWCGKEWHIMTEAGYVPRTTLYSKSLP